MSRKNETEQASYFATTDSTGLRPEVTEAEALAHLAANIVADQAERDADAEMAGMSIAEKIAAEDGAALPGRPAAPAKLPCLSRIQAARMWRLARINGKAQGRFIPLSNIPADITALGFGTGATCKSLMRAGLLDNATTLSAFGQAWISDQIARAEREARSLCSRHGQSRAGAGCERCNAAEAPQVAPVPTAAEVGNMLAIVAGAIDAPVPSDPMPIGPRGQVHTWHPSTEAHGASRTWRREINGTDYSFNVVNMPDGELRLFVSRHNGYPDKRFACAWTRCHSIIIRPGAEVHATSATGHALAEAAAAFLGFDLDGAIAISTADREAYAAQVRAWRSRHYIGATFASMLSSDHAEALALNQLCDWRERHGYISDHGPIGAQPFGSSALDAHRAGVDHAEALHENLARAQHIAAAVARRDRRHELTPRWGVTEAMARVEVDRARRALWRAGLIGGTHLVDDAVTADHAEAILVDLHRPREQFYAVSRLGTLHRVRVGSCGWAVIVHEWPAPASGHGQHFPSWITERPSLWAARATLAALRATYELNGARILGAADAALVDAAVASRDPEAIAAAVRTVTGRELGAAFTEATIMNARWRPAVAR